MIGAKIATTPVKVGHPSQNQMRKTRKWAAAGSPRLCGSGRGVQRPCVTARAN